MNWIKQRFDEKYRQWQIEIPPDDLTSRQSGVLQQDGWTIRYTFGREGERAYMDYFASHRMTNDTLNRIYSDGTCELLGYCMEFYLANDPQAKREYLRHNRAFYALVKALGLD